MRPRGVLCQVGWLAGKWDYGLPWPPSTVRLTMYKTEHLATETATPVLQAIVDGIPECSYRANIHEVFHELPRRGAALHQLVGAWPAMLHPSSPREPPEEENGGCP